MMNTYKTSKMGITVIGSLAFALALSGCERHGNGPAGGDEHNHDHSHHEHSHQGHAHDDRVAPLLSAAVMAEYIVIQEALASDSVEGVAEHAGKLAEKLASAGDAAGAEAAGSIAGAGGIEETRRHFEAVSRSVIESMKAHGAPDGEYFQAYCSMAFGDRGASWVQVDTTINNPYFGSRMLRCGGVREIFRAK